MSIDIKLKRVKNIMYIYNIIYMIIIYMIIICDIYNI